MQERQFVPLRERTGDLKRIAKGDRKTNLNADASQHLPPHRHQHTDPWILYDERSLSGVVLPDRRGKFVCERDCGRGFEPFAGNRPQAHRACAKSCEYAVVYIYNVLWFKVSFRIERISRYHLAWQGQP